MNSTINFNINNANIVLNLHDKFPNWKKGKPDWKPTPSKPRYFNQQ